MKKVAVFVEGLTEQEFVVHLVTALLGNKGIHFQLARQFRGTVQITSPAPVGAFDFFILIVDCASDERVKTQIRDEYASLVASGYTAIIGLRDVYPFSHAEIPAILALLDRGLPVGPVVPKIHLAIMEVEAWFLAETTHFSRLHPSLTVPYIVAGGFGIETIAAESWPHPAVDLDAIYRLAGMRYTSSGGHRKSKKRIKRTIDALSPDELYMTVRQKVGAFRDFVDTLEASLF